MFIPDTLLNMIIYMIKLVSVPVQLYRECPRTFLTTLVHIKGNKKYRLKIVEFCVMVKSVNEDGYN